MDVTNFTDWGTLATFAGACAMTAVLVQFTKGLIDKLIHIPTQIYCYLIALILLYLAYGFTGQLSVDNAALLPINAVLVALASNGVHTGITRMTQQKK